MGGKEKEHFLNAARGVSDPWLRTSRKRDCFGEALLAESENRLSQMDDISSVVGSYIRAEINLETSLIWNAKSWRIILHKADYSQSSSKIRPFKPKTD